MGIGVQNTFNSQKNNEGFENQITGNGVTGANIGWDFGGFLGAGVVFGDTISHGVGLEWMGKFESSYRSRLGEDGSLKASVKETTNAFGEFADIYYRLGLNMVKGLPMGLQFNLGLAHRALLSVNTKTKVEQGGTSVVDRDDPYQFGKDGAENISALGIHAGVRYNVHMFFVGLDYSYFPAYDYKLDNKKESVKTSDETSTWGGNQISFNVGVTLNKAILDSFMGK